MSDQDQTGDRGGDREPTFQELLEEVITKLQTHTGVAAFAIAAVSTDGDNRTSLGSLTDEDRQFAIDAVLHFDLVELATSALFEHRAWAQRKSAEAKSGLVGPGGGVLH